MTFNILNIGFGGDIASTYADRTGYQSDGDTNDIFYFIGTNFDTSSWSNPASSSFLNITTTGPTLGDNNQTVNNNLGNDGVYNNAHQSSASVIYDFSNLIVSPTQVQIGVYSDQVNNNQFLLKQMFLDGSNDGTNWTQLTSIPDTFPTVNTTVWAPLATISNDNFWSFIRFRYSVFNGFASVRFSEIKLYGFLKRTDGGEASRVSLPQTINQLPDVDINSPQDGDYLYWAGGKVKHQREKLYETIRTTTSITLEDNQYLPNFYIITPTQTETVDLPPNPVAGQFFRIRNLDNIFQIDIREAGPTVIASIGGAGGPGLTQADCYYDGTEWTVIQY